MCRIAYRLLVILLTFVIGVSAAWYAGILTKAEILLAKAAPDLVFGSSNRGCGCGWTQSYSMLDGRLLKQSSTSICKTIDGRSESQLVQEKLQSILDKASKIVKSIPQYNSVLQREGERIELLYLNESGEERAKIIWCDNETVILEIDAPSLEIATVFEDSKHAID